MSLAKTYSAQLIGLVSEIITLEVDISNGLHSFSIVGLGDRSVEEAKDRVSAAIKNSGYISPKQKNQKVVVSMAPADIHKEGPSFDLAIAIAYLSAAEDIVFTPENTLLLGELSLEGRIRKVSGLLPILCQAPIHKFKQAFIPKDNVDEASLAQGLTIFPVSTLTEVIDHITGLRLVEPLKLREENEFSSINTDDQTLDMSIIRGNESAKRGLEIAAAGAHNIIMCGLPGTGKTMLAKSFCSILPNLSYEESVEVTGIHSAARILGTKLIIRPPFRSPHHTASYPSIVGGGSFPRPGEITLAHRGVLFLDEFPEFSREVIEALRQPLEDRLITISRARGIITFPAQCILIASMNPCPCGLGRENNCTCTTRTLEMYKRKISGPIIDRLDVWLNINMIDYGKLAAPVSTSETSETIRNRVQKARMRQKSRFQKNNIRKSYNSEMDARDIERFANISDEARKILTASSEKLKMSGRAFHRIIKVARTISDLSDSDTIMPEHIFEAIQYRQRNL
ncbi:MAG: YifB family Mg chelatase-like AAA ATPase [Candidatus Paceibacterota bacterium]|jgi:magnesium chelatase family protein